jgi:hypothetical protein
MIRSGGIIPKWPNFSVGELWYSRITPHETIDDGLLMISISISTNVGKTIITTTHLGMVYTTYGGIWMVKMAFYPRPGGFPEVIGWIVITMVYQGSGPAVQCWKLWWRRWASGGNLGEKLPKCRSNTIHRVSWAHFENARDTLLTDLGVNHLWEIWGST